MRTVKKNGSFLIFFAAFIFFSGVLSGCSAKKQPELFAVDGDVYGKIVSETFPEYETTEITEQVNLFSKVKKGNLWECYDVQAKSALNLGLPFFWYPQCTSTVVFAVQDGILDSEPHSWKDLLKSDAEVSWIYQNEAERKLLFGAMAYGLGEGQPDRQAVTDVLYELQSRNRFSGNNWDAPVLILTDTEAVRAIHEGKKLKLVIPEDGTYSCDMGILSGKTLEKFPPEEKLLQAGLRLTDGRSRDRNYPSAAQYHTAVKVQDIQNFLQITENAARDIDRKVLHVRLYAPADSRETVMTVMIAVVCILLWIGSAVHRSVRPGMQILIIFSGMQTVLWLILMLIKYQLPDLVPATRYCWYGYYIFQIGLPVNFLWIALTVDDEKLSFPSVMRIVTVIGAVFLGLVFTNDLHYLVFRFDINGNWSDEYSYGPVYFMIYAFIFLIFVSAVVLLIVKSIRSPKKWRWILPFGSACLLVGYTVGYAAGCPAVRSGNYTLSFCVLSVFFMESALHTGLIPTNTQYRQLFAESPLALQILNLNGDTVLAGKMASSLPCEVRKKFVGEKKVSIPWKKDSLLMGRKICGGTVVWEEDRTELNKLHNRTLATSKQLQAANRLLRQERAVRRQKLEIRSRTELFDSLENEIVERTEELSEAIDSLSGTADHEEKIAYITLLLCHIKRRCNLFFLAKEGKQMPSGELTMYLDELCEFARYAGVTALFRCTLESSMNIRMAVFCYDFCYEILAWSVRRSRASLLGELGRKGKEIEFRVLSSDCPEETLFSDNFLANIQKSGGTVFQKKLDEETGIYLRLPEGGNT